MWHMYAIDTSSNIKNGVVSFAERELWLEKLNKLKMSQKEKIPQNIVPRFYIAI